MISRFPVFLPESREMAAKTVVGWALRGADHVPAKALRLLYYPGRGALVTSRPRDHEDVFASCRRELLIRSLVSRGLARDASELLTDHRALAERKGWLKEALNARWSADRLRVALGFKNRLLGSDSGGADGFPASDSGGTTGVRAYASARDLKDAATRIRAILVSRTLEAMREVGDIVSQVRDASGASYRALAEETGLGISHTALRNAEKVAIQYDLLPPWVRDSLPYSHHVMLLPVHEIAAKRVLACRAFRRSVPMSLREFQQLVGSGTAASALPAAQAPDSRWLLSLHELVGSGPTWDRLLSVVSELPRDELEQGVELVGDALDQLSHAEETLAVELARRRNE